MECGLQLPWRKQYSVLDFLTSCAFTGTDRGLLRSVLGPWSPVPKCEAPGAPISVEEHTSMAPGPRRQRQNPQLQKSSAVPALPWPSNTTFEVFTRVSPDNSLERLTERSVGLVTDRPS